MYTELHFSLFNSCLCKPDWVCLYMKKEITQWLEDMNVILSWQKQNFSHSLRSFAECFYQSKIQFVSCCRRVICSIHDSLSNLCLGERSMSVVLGKFHSYPLMLSKDVMTRKVRAMLVCFLIYITCKCWLKSNLNLTSNLCKIGHKYFHHGVPHRTKSSFHGLSALNLKWTNE